MTTFYLRARAYRLVSTAFSAGVNRLYRLPRAYDGSKPESGDNTDDDYSKCGEPSVCSGSDPTWIASAGTRKGISRSIGKIKHTGLPTLLQAQNGRQRAEGRKQQRRPQNGRRCRNGQSLASRNDRDGLR